jgi:hypothetical protein
MTTSRALTQRILLPMMRATADGLARLGLERAPQPWEEAEADPFAIATGGESSTDGADRRAGVPARTGAVATTPVKPAALPGPDAAEPAGAVLTAADRSVSSPQSPIRGDATSSQSGSFMGSDHPSLAPTNAVTTTPADRAAIPGPHAFDEPAGAFSTAAANAPRSAERRSRSNQIAARLGDRALGDGAPDDRAPDDRGPGDRGLGDRAPDDRAPNDDRPAMHDLPTRASASTKVNGYPDDEPVGNESVGSDSPRQMLARHMAPQSPIRLPTAGSSREAGGGEPVRTPTFTPESAPHALDTHAALDPGRRPFVTRTSDANDVDTRAQSIGRSEHTPPAPNALAPGRIPVRPVAAAPRDPGAVPIPWNSGSFGGIGRPQRRGNGATPARANDGGTISPGEFSADGAITGAERVREALSPMLGAASPDFGDDGIGLADDGSSSTAGRPQASSTVNVNVAIGSAAAAAAWNATDPVVREALRDALIEILRDDARRQGIDL